MMARRHGEAGFSLAEVLVALAILSGAVLGAIALISQSTRTAIDIEQRLVASIAAENIIAETFSASEINFNMPSSGSTIIAGQNLLWQREITQTSLAGLYLVKVDILAAESDRSILSMSAYREASQ